MFELSVELTIQMMLLPVPLLAVVVRRPAQRLTILLQEGLSKHTRAQVIAEALEEEEVAGVCP